MTKAYSRRDVEYVLHERNNWGRWGDDDEIGAVNLITPEKRVRAARLVQTGISVSLSRPFPTNPGSSNPFPAAHYMKVTSRGSDAGDADDVGAPGAGVAVDYYGLQYHGTSCTHLDALCHAWDEHGMWNGRNPGDEITTNGSRWAGIEKWMAGIITRGIFLDVPAFRGQEFVQYDEPVQGDELEAIVRRQNISLEPGDAVVVYSGRDKWDQENAPWGGELTDSGKRRRAGLHASCLEFFRDNDCALLAWDMQDFMPNEWGIPWTVHGAIFAFGLALLDNCELGPLSVVCRGSGRYEFMLTVSPLVVVGGTGSPVNPIALF